MYSRQILATKEHKIDQWVVTNEGAQVIDKGSPEFAVANAATKEGRSRDDIFVSAVPLQKEATREEKAEREKDLVAAFVSPCTRVRIPLTLPFLPHLSPPSNVVSMLCVTQAEIGTDVGNIGLGKAMKSKWIKTEKRDGVVFVVRHADQVTDIVQAQLKGIQAESADILENAAALKDLKKRKLIEKKCVQPQTNHAKQSADLQQT